MSFFLVFIILFKFTTCHVTIESEVSLVGLQCPGTVRLFCEGTGLTILQWRFNETNNIGKNFFPDDRVGTIRAVSNPAFVSVELTAVSQSSVHRSFGNFSSILTVDLSQLEQQTIRSISCGDALSRISTPVNIHIMQDTLPGDPEIVGVNVTHKSNELATITVIWRGVISGCYQEVRFLVNLLWNYTNIFSIVNSSMCIPICMINFTVSVLDIKIKTYILSILSRNNIGISNTVFHSGVIQSVPVIQCEIPPSFLNVSSERNFLTLPLGSEVTYHCDDGLFSSTCTVVGGKGEWLPDPAQLLITMCQTKDLKNLTVNPGVVESLSIKAVAGVSAVAAFCVALIIGCFCGLILRYIVPHKKVKITSVQPSTLVGPVYDEVSTCSTQSQKEIELNTNLAYGPIN